jgi:hypothetical protein
MKLKRWVLFLVVQAVEMILPRFANVHSNVAPLIFGMGLLLPGSIAALIFSERLPSWLQVMIIVGFNAFVWWSIPKLWSMADLDGAKSAPKQD